MAFCLPFHLRKALLNLLTGRSQVSLPTVVELAQGVDGGAGWISPEMESPNFGTSLNIIEIDSVGNQKITHIGSMVLAYMLA